ncbi:MAG: DUF192 domain-containing protein [Actinomycetota bacterium]
MSCSDAESGESGESDSATTAPADDDGDRGEDAGGTTTDGGAADSTEVVVDDAGRAKAEPARTAGDVDAPPGVLPESFTTVTVRITDAAGDVCEVCLWLADDGAERSRGLMGVTDLGEPVGMLFRFDQPTSGNFFMFGTPMPLSIAWFGTDGRHVAETDMTPCLVDDASSCERYGPGADYVLAVEMVQDELDVIGIGAGSTLTVLDEHEDCPIES